MRGIQKAESVTYKSSGNLSSLSLSYDLICMTFHYIIPYILELYSLMRVICIRVNACEYKCTKCQLKLLCKTAIFLFGIPQNVYIYMQRIGGRHACYARIQCLILHIWIIIKLRNTDSVQCIQLCYTHVQVNESWGICQGDHSKRFSSLGLPLMSADSICRWSARIDEMST